MILVGISKSAPSSEVAIKTYGVYRDLLKLKMREVSYAHLLSGAPRLNGADEVHISLSHSGEWVVCALSDSPVGIDIQLKKDIDYLKIAKRYGFNAQTLDDFYKSFTLAEAYSKMSGTALPSSLKLANTIDGKTYPFIKDYALSVVGKGNVIFVTL